MLSKSLDLLGRVCAGSMFVTGLLQVLLRHVWQIEARDLSSAPDKSKTSEMALLGIAWI